MRQRVEGNAPGLPQSRTALKFLDKATMDDAVNTAYTRFRAEIIDHFKAGGDYKEWSLDTGKPVGEGFTNTGTRANPVVRALTPAEVTKVTISFNKNPAAPGGFYLVSGFPAWP